MINVFYSYFRDIMIKSKLNNRIVQVTHISSIHDFSIIQEKDLRWSNELKSQLNHPELLTAAKMFQDKVNLKIGETVLAQHPQDQMYYRAKIVNYKSDQVHVYFMDCGNFSKLDPSSLLPCPSKYQEIIPLSIRCSIFGCFSLKDETIDVFKSLVVNEKFLLQVMDVDLKRKILEVDLIMNVEDNVKFTSVRDVLIFCGRAVFETNPYSALPNINCHTFDYFQPLTEGSRHEVFISHIPVLWSCPNCPPGWRVFTMSGTARKCGT